MRNFSLFISKMFTTNPFQSPAINFRAENSSLLKQASAYSRAIYRSEVIVMNFEFFNYLYLQCI